jgi:hypothetical protein
MWICFCPKLPMVGNGSTSGLKLLQKVTSCQVEAMQYILLALVYFGGYCIIMITQRRIKEEFTFQALVSRMRSDFMENMIITFSA